MNKHLKTLIVFKYGTKRIVLDVKDTVLEIGEDLLKTFKKLCYVILVLAGWLIGLLLIIFLPVATWFRLKCEKENQVALEKAREAYLNRMSPVSEGDSCG